MDVVKTYKFKLYNSHRNKKLHTQIDAAGLTYNHCVALHKRYYRLYHKHLNQARLQKHLVKLKKLPRFSYLTEYGSQAVQNVAELIEFGYKKFFAKQNKRPPKFRKVWKTKSFLLKQAGWKLDEENHAIIINGQKYRYHKSREIEGTIKTITVKRDKVGDIYIFITCRVEVNQVIPRLGKSIGFDFGFKKYILVAPTPEDDVDMPMFFQQNRQKLKAVKRSVSRKLLANTDHYVKKGKGLAPVYKRPLNECKNLQKAFKEQARMYRRITNKREDYHWRLAYELCGKYAIICLESLNMRWMSKKHGKKVGDYGFSNFKRILKYVAFRCGTTIVEIDKWYPSSQFCHDCGFQNKAIKDLRIREWDCPQCGHHLDRDRNAARNILKEGLRQFEAEAAS